MLDVSSFEEQVALALLHFTMKEFAQFRFDCNDDVDRPGGESDKSRQIDAMMNNIGKYVSVKLIVKYDGERYFWNVKEIEFVEPNSNVSSCMSDSPDAGGKRKLVSSTGPED